MSGLMALEGLWLNNYVNPADGLELRVQPGWRPRTTRPRDVRKYGGRRRSVAALWPSPSGVPGRGG